MNLLLDTHVALWAVSSDRRLKREARALLDGSHEVSVSVVSLWEIAIKHALNRQGAGRMPMSAEAAFGEFRDAGFQLASVTADHALAVDRLPRLHGDPFDRLLVAQAVAEPFRLVTHDQRLTAYGPSVILV